MWAVVFVVVSIERLVRRRIILCCASPSLRRISVCRVHMRVARCVSDGAAPNSHLVRPRILSRTCHLA